MIWNMQNALDMAWRGSFKKMDIYFISLGSILWSLEDLVISYLSLHYITW